MKYISWDKKMSKKFLLALVVAVAVFGFGIGKSQATGGVTMNGLVYGLSAGETLTVLNNGVIKQSNVINGIHAFSIGMLVGDHYNITFIAPASKSCSIIDINNGIAPNSDFTIDVTCSVKQISLSGTVSGLASGKQVSLDNKDGFGFANISGNESFTLSSTIDYGSSYHVVVSTQPSGQACAVTNGSGVANGNVTNIQVACGAGHTLGGIIVGLGADSFGVTLQEENSGDESDLDEDGNFLFGDDMGDGTTDYLFPTGASYNITVFQQPDDRTCSVVNGSGTVGTGNVTSIEVICGSGNGAPAVSVSKSSVLLTWTTDSSVIGGVIFGSKVTTKTVKHTVVINGKKKTTKTKTTGIAGSVSADSSARTGHVFFKSGLKKSATYYYQIVSRNADGTYTPQGGIVKFKTAKK